MTARVASTARPQCRRCAELRRMRLLAGRAALAAPTLPAALLSMDRPGCAALVRLENKHVALQSANAYISTLGGGHFLCRHVPSAVALAQAQIRVAVELGDLSLAARCHVHLAYCAVLVGRFRSAAVLLTALAGVAAATDDAVLGGMVTAARRHNRLTHRMWRAGAVRFADPHRARLLGDEREVGDAEGRETMRFTRALLRVTSPEGLPSAIARTDELFRLHLVPLSPVPTQGS